MAQAKTLSKAELKRVLDVAKACSKYAERDCTMLLLTHWCGMRVGEVAALRVEDVLDSTGAVNAYSGEREHSVRLNVNTFSLNALPTEVCTPGVHVQSIS